MAVRIQNGEEIDFGTLAAETAITHARVSVGGSILFTRPLTTARTIAAGGGARFNVGDIDIVLPSNELQDAGYKALLDMALDGTTVMTVDAMTDASTIVSASGYTQGSSTDWNLTTEND